jgi:hypothetical protein
MSPNPVKKLLLTKQTPSGKLGVKSDIVNKKRLEYYNPCPMPANFLFIVDGVEIGQPILKKYIQLVPFD